MLFSDDFSDGNADGWTTTGLGTWSANTGVYVVDMGSGTQREGNSVAGDTTWTDYSYEVDIQGISGVDRIISARYSDDNNRYTLNIRSEPFNDVVLQKHVNGVVTILDTESFPNTNNVWYHVQFVLSGPNIIIFINNKLVINYADRDPHPTQGKIGLVGWTGGTGTNIVHFDNVVVRAATKIYIPIALR